MKTFLALLLFCNATFSASFDCVKAESKQELLICSNKELSRLDDELAGIYREARNISKATKLNQQYWLQHVRNECSTASSLMEAHQERIHYLKKIKERNLDSSEVILVGYWKFVGQGPFDEVEFSLDGKFRSWLNNAPEIVNNAWKINNNEIVIAGDEEIFRATILKIGQNEVQFRESSSKDSYTIQRIP